MEALVATGYKVQGGVWTREVSGLTNRWLYSGHVSMVHPDRPDEPETVQICDEEDDVYSEQQRIRDNSPGA
jgi:hypothetical protein